MMKKNIVLIETLNSTGTGILYPCKFEDEKNKFQNHFIIFTNSHILKDVGRSTKQDQDVREFVKLQIFDDTGKCVEDEDIQEIRVYNPGWDYEKQNDIAALLVAVRGYVALTLETNIFTDRLENRAALYMEGYPGVMLDDEVSQKLQLKGMSKSIFPESSKIGVYQITDEYHWYNGIRDRQLLSGLSGSPVYVERNGRGMLVGMNQSVSDIARGENPFKLVYYLKIEYILDCLREEGCILFQRVDEYTYEVEWIYGKEATINTYVNKPAFLLIGGSGAGKSSFATDFAYHGSELLATNDGQTTRTSVIYEYHIFEKEPRAVIQFMQQNAFGDRMLELKGARGILFIFRNLFGFSEDICKNEYRLLEDCSELLKVIKDKDDKMSVEDFLEDREAKKDKESLIKWYQKLLECILDTIPFSLVRYVCDKEWVEKCREKFLNSYEKQFLKDGIDLEKEFINKYLLADKKKQCKINNTGSDYDMIIKQMDETQIFDVLEWYCRQKKSNFKEYLSKCLEKCQAYRGKAEAVKFENYKICEQKIFTEDFKKKYIRYTLFCEGFFEITEFSFLKSSQEIEKEIEEKIGNGLIAKEARLVRDAETEIFDFDIFKGMKLIYECFHDILIDAMMEHKIGIQKNNYEITISLKQMKEKERKLLQYCLQVANGKSLTGMVLLVRIHDMISNPYAMELKKQKIKHLTIIDTHGLDHVQGVWNMEDALYDIIYTCQKQKIALQEINVLYLKKLDSGKPDELRNILPVVYKVIPQSPMYCIFTGIDIFYQTQERIRNINWGRLGDEKAPKAVRYILSSKGKREMIENLQGSTDRKNNMYLVLKNNLIPYCGKRELIQQNYIYYQNNVKYIRKLLASIVMKEYSSLEIVSLDKFEDMKKNKEAEKEFRKQVENIIKHIFQRASINGYKIHFQTLKANLRNITGKELLGYCRSYRHQWNQRFHEAYAEVISEMGGELAECYGTTYGAFEAALSNMEQNFLGDSEHLRRRKLGKNTDKSEFRIYLEEMFDQKDKYKRNPFREELSEQELTNMGTEKRREMFDEFFDFAKGLKCEDILKKFTDKFIRNLEEQIKMDNAVKAENVIMINRDFAEAMEELENIFEEKYSMDGTVNTLNLYTIMQYYFESKVSALKNNAVLQGDCN